MKNIPENIPSRILQIVRNQPVSSKKSRPYVKANKASPLPFQPRHDSAGVALDIGKFARTVNMLCSNGPPFVSFQLVAFLHCSELVGRRDVQRR